VLRQRRTTLPPAFCFPPERKFNQNAVAASSPRPNYFDAVIALSNISNATSVLFDGISGGDPIIVVPAPSRIGPVQTLRFYAIAEFRIRFAATLSLTNNAKH
jgi:hypothetical protein